MADMQKFDVIVIGGGSGLTAAYYARRDGKSVALVESNPNALGGTCVNRGCIPTKGLMQAAQVMNTVRSAHHFGIELDQTTVHADFGRILQSVRDRRANDAAGVKEWVDDAFTPFYSRVRFVDDKVLETEAGERLTGDMIFIASGAKPFIPPMPALDEDDVWTNEDVLELEHQPDSLIVLGAGYVGAELGHFFVSLGTDVTLIDSGEPLAREDEDVRELFSKEFARRVRLLSGYSAERAIQQGRQKGFALKHLETGASSKVLADQILVAAGRAPNNDDLRLDRTGVKTTDAGWIEVDAYLRTSHPDILAYGDAIGQAMFKHTSSYEGEVAYDNSQGVERTVSYAANPHAVFTEPQIGSVGLTEEACRQRGLDYRATKKDYTSVAKGRIIGAQAGFAKLLSEDGSGRLLGFHMIGPQAADLVHEVVVAMSAGLTVKDVQRAIHIHPTLPELIDSVFGEAA